jgi:hypothetical protein
MLHFFRVHPESVRWELHEATGGASYDLTVHHAGGTVVESFGSREAADERVHQLEDLLFDALEDEVTA